MAIQETRRIQLIREPKGPDDTEIIIANQIETADGFKTLSYGPRLTEDAAKLIYPKQFSQPSVSESIS